MVGAALVIGLLAIAIGTHVRRVVPEQQREQEFLHMRSVRRSFTDLKTAIESLTPGDVITVDVKMNADPVFLLPSLPRPGSLTATPAYAIDKLKPIAGTWVDEASPTATNGADNVAWVMPTSGRRRWSYYKFDINDSYMISYNKVDGVLVRATLWVYVDQVLYMENGGWIPVDVEARRVASDDWGEMTLNWDTAQSDAYRPGDLLDTKSGAFAVDDNGEWVGFDVTEYVQEHVDSYPRDNRVSICVREVERPPSSLNRGAAFISENVDFYYRRDVYDDATYNYNPYLEFIYLKPREVTDAKYLAARYGREGLLESGTIEFDSQNQRYPQQSYIWQNGAVILRQGWRATMILPPSDLITATPTPQGFVRITVTRYRIVSQGGFSGTGAASIKVWIVDNRWLTYSEMPNRSKVVITLPVYYPLSSAWSDYLQAQVRVINLAFGQDPNYGNAARLDFNRLALIVGGREGGETHDIVYCERLIDLGVEIK